MRLVLPVRAVGIEPTLLAEPDLVSHRYRK
jgi:hypothetical protein